MAVEPKNYLLGLSAKLYTSATLWDATNQADDTEISTTLSSMDEAGATRDLTLNLETGQSDITTREAGGWRQYAPTLSEGSIDFEVLAKKYADAPTEDPLYAIRTAWENKSEVAVAVLDEDRDIQGTTGLISNMVVTNFSRGEPLEEAIIYTVEMQPSSYSKWWTKPGAP